MSEKELLKQLINKVLYGEAGVGLRIGLKSDTPLRVVDLKLHDALMEFIEKEQVW